MTLEQIGEAPAAPADLTRVMDRLIRSEAGQATNDIERLVSVGMTIDGAPTMVGKGGRASTKIVRVLPSDVNAVALEARLGTAQGLNATTTNVGMTGKDLDQLAADMAVRAAAP